MVNETNPDELVGILVGFVVGLYTVGATVGTSKVVAWSSSAMSPSASIAALKLTKSMLPNPVATQ